MHTPQGQNLIKGRVVSVPLTKLNITLGKVFTSDSWVIPPECRGVS